MCDDYRWSLPYTQGSKSAPTHHTTPNAKHEKGIAVFGTKRWADDTNVISRTTRRTREAAALDDGSDVRTRARLEQTTTRTPADARRQNVAPALVGLLVLLGVTGWRPWSRALVEAPAPPPSCSCIGAGTETRPAELPLQRKSYLPSLPAKAEAGCGAARSLPPSTAAAFLRTTLAELATSPCDARTLRWGGMDIQPVFAGRHRALGPLLHALVPLVWQVGLSSDNRSNGLLAPALQGLLGASTLNESSAGRPRRRSCIREPTLACYLEGFSDGTADSCNAAGTKRHEQVLVRVRRDVSTPAEYEYASRRNGALPTAYVRPAVPR
jgi:hypothetical protein